VIHAEAEQRLGPGVDDGKYDAAHRRRLATGAAAMSASGDVLVEDVPLARKSPVLDPELYETLRDEGESSSPTVCPSTTPVATGGTWSSSTAGR